MSMPLRKQITTMKTLKQICQINKKAQFPRIQNLTRVVTPLSPIPFSINLERDNNGQASWHTLAIISASRLEANTMVANHTRSLFMNLTRRAVIVNIDRLKKYSHKDGHTCDRIFMFLVQHLEHVDEICEELFLVEFCHV